MRYFTIHGQGSGFFFNIFLGKKNNGNINYGPLCEKLPMMLLLIRYRLIGSLVNLSSELISDFVHIAIKVLQITETDGRRSL